MLWPSVYCHAKMHSHVSVAHKNVCCLLDSACEFASLDFYTNGGLFVRISVSLVPQYTASDTRTMLSSVIAFQVTSE